MPSFDPAHAIITTVTTGLRNAFDPGQDVPPTGGGTAKIRFLSGDGVVMDPECGGDPFIWLRVESRYRSELFPDVSPLLNPCSSREVIGLEIGVARCSSITLDGESDYEEIEKEAIIALDDSWRLMKLGCWLRGHFAQAADTQDYDLGFDTITPYGPQGGVVAQVTTIYVGF